MTRRLLLLLVGVAVLTALLVSSQLRQEPLRVSGSIEADEIRLGSRVGGRVAQVHVQEGDRVKANDPLVELEPYDLLHREQEAIGRVEQCQADLDRLRAGFREEEIGQAQAHVDECQAQLDLLEHGPRPQELTAAEARLRVALAQKELAQQTFDRTKNLAERNAVSTSEFERATEGLKAAESLQLVREKELELLQEGTRSEEIQHARARLRKAQEALDLTQKGYRPEEIRQAEALLVAAQAQLAAIRAQRVELTIRAPLDATVEAVELQPGDMVAAGAPVLSLVDRRKLWVRAYVPGSLNVRLDQSVSVTVDGLGGPPIPGRVVFRARQAEFTPSNVQTVEERSRQVFRIKVALQAQENLWPGMTAEVWFPSSAESKP